MGWHTIRIGCALLVRMGWHPIGIGCALLVRDGLGWLCPPGEDGLWWECPLGEDAPMLGWEDLPGNWSWHEKFRPVAIQAREISGHLANSSDRMSFIILNERQLFLMTRYLTEALDDIDPELHGDNFPMDHYAVSMMVLSGMSYSDFNDAWNKTPIDYADLPQRSRLIQAYRKMQLKFDCCVFSEQPKKKIYSRSSRPRECWTKWWSSMGLGPLLMGRGTATFYLS